MQQVATADTPPIEEPVYDYAGDIDVRATLDLLAAEPPGPEGGRVLSMLTSMRQSLTPNERVDLVLQLDRHESWVAAQKQLALAACGAETKNADGTTRNGAREDIVLELGLGLAWSEGMTRDRLDTAEQMCERLPQTWMALANGVINYAKAREIANGASKLVDDAQAAALETRVLAKASDQIQSEVRKSVERAVIALDPKGAEERRQQTRRDRRVTRRLLEDGGAHLGVTGPAEAIAVIHAALTNGARALKLTDQVASLDQGRFDTLLHWAIRQLDERTLPDRGPLPVGATLIVKASTAAKEDDEPAEVAGFGPITAQAARDLLAGRAPAPGPFEKWCGKLQEEAVPRSEQYDADYLAERQRGEPAPPDDELPPDDWEWRPPRQPAPPPGPLARDVFAVAWRVLKVDPATGWAMPPPGIRLDFGTSRRYATPAQARYVRDRDRTCGMPICGQTGGQVEIDHRVAAADGGPTDVCTLGPGCPHHNRVTRNRSDWKIEPNADGSATLVTPQGRRYPIRPHDYLS